METLYNQQTQKNRSNDRVQKFLNVKEIRDGIVVLKSGQLRSIILVSSINFFLMNEEEQNAIIYAYQGFLNALDFPIQIVIQSKKLNIKQYINRVNEQAKLQENELLRQQTELYGSYIGDLVELANITTNHFYVVISSGSGVDLPNKVGLVDRLKNFLNPAQIAQQKMAGFAEQQEELERRVANIASGLRGMGLRAARLNTQEVVELLYATYNPGSSDYQILADLEKLDIIRK
ncbi:MAG: hypothetical protein ABIE68_00445 [bacterium]